MKTFDSLRPSILLLALCMVASGLANGDEICVKGGKIALVFHQAGPTLVSITDPAGSMLPAEGSGIQFRDGRTGKDLLPTGAWKPTPNGQQLEGRLGDSPVSLKVRCDGGERAITCAVELVNGGSQQQLLVVTLAMPLLTRGKLSVFHARLLK